LVLLDGVAFGAVADLTEKLDIPGGIGATSGDRDDVVVFEVDPA